MKTNTKRILFIFLLMFLLIGCTSIKDSISEDEARQLVIEKHSRVNVDGTPEIISIVIKRNSYYVEWKNEDNKEWGIDRVTKDGEVKMIEATIE